MSGRIPSLRDETGAVSISVEVPLYVYTIIHVLHEVDAKDYNTIIPHIGLSGSSKESPMFSLYTTLCSR